MNKVSKIIVVISLLCISSWTTVMGQGQRFSFVDTDYILQNIPEYADAQAQLNELSKEWQTEIDAKFAEIDKMYRTYQSEKVMMPEELKKQKEEAIVAAEKSAKDLQMQRFGPDGDLFKKREELVKPIQDKIYTAIETIAAQKNLGIVFDKAGAVTMMYANVKFDISDDVLSEMGYGFNIKK
ncbi:MAG: OmpH family outer membrane protein [Bacteroidales bacterium]|nr:OmpH family outer membrane protein [Bacteroidales bacterium]